MKKITFLLLLVLMGFEPVFGQCTNTTAYPTDPITANNSGILQVLNTNVYTQEYHLVSGLVSGGDYIFTCVSNSDEIHKYITVKNSSGVNIAHGLSPLTVNDITATNIELHFTEDAACVTNNTGHTSTLFAVLSCPLPVTVEMSAVTTTTASFTWAAGGTETAWQVLVLADGADGPTATTTGIPVATTPGYTTTTPLTPGTSYQFYIRANCGSEFSPWGGPFDFTTVCTPTATFTETAETTPLGEVPLCWSSVLTDASEYASVRVIDYNFQQGAKAIILNNSDSDDTAEIRLVSPPLSTLTTGNYRVKFYAVAYGETEIEVGTVNSTLPGATFTLREAVAINDEYAEYVVDFTGYIGTDTFLAFRHPNMETYTSLFLDNIRWELTPLCPDVTDIEASAITTTGATITWTAGGAEAQWDVAYGLTTVTDPALATLVTPAPTAATANITGLADNTNYKVWVRSACGTTTGNGAWIGPIEFKTACLATNAISENFNATTTFQLPDCWSSLVQGEEVSEYAYVQISSTGGVGGSRGVNMYNSGSAPGSDILLVSPNLSNLSAGTHRLKFFARVSGGGSVEVGTLNSPSEGGIFTTYETVEITGNYAEYAVNFTGYTGPDTYIAIKHTSANYTDVFIDDIKWELAPLCADVTEVEVVGVTTTGASLFWVANGAETEWDVAYGAETVTNPADATLVSPAPTVSPGATLSGLSPNTVYNVWVRSACGGTIGDGAWVGPVTFTTACVPVGIFFEDFDTTDEDELPSCWSAVIAGETVSEYATVGVTPYESASGDNSVELYNSSSSTDDYVMLISPNVNTLSAGTHRLKFKAMSYGDGSIQVGTLNGNTAAGTFTMLEEITTPDVEEFVEYVVDFTVYTGTDTYIGIRNASGTYTSVFVDDVRWEVAPLCPDVTGITITNVGTAAATVNWNVGAGTGWQVVYGPASSTTTPPTPGPAITTATQPLSGLTDNTTYNVWVRTVCGSTGDGAWIGPVSFSTLCVSQSLPYVQDFESSTEPALPSCTTSINLGTGNSWVVEDAPNTGAGFSSNTLTYNYDTENAADTWFFTRGLQLTAGTSYNISYRYGDNANDQWSESLKVMCGLSPDAGGMTQLIADHPEINSGVAAENTVSFTVPTTGVYYFGFHAYSGINQYYLYVDDIEIDTVLSTGTVQQGMFTYYPNPVKDKLNLSYTDTINSVAVYNILGQAVITSAVNQNETSIDMSRLPAGNYIVKVSAGDATKTIKIVKD
ncbi:MAG: choice-of-anchor J domain-containing protein [Flavobacterium sp.]